MNLNMINGMTIIPVICEARQEFKFFLSYIEGSRLACAIEIIQRTNTKRVKGRAWDTSSVYKLSDGVLVQYAPSSGLHLKDGRTKDFDNVMNCKTLPLVLLFMGKENHCRHRSEPTLEGGSFPLLFSMFSPAPLLVVLRK